MHSSFIGILVAAVVVPGVVAAAPPAQGHAQGTVVRVDAAQGKIAIRHGAIPALDLPAMTLVYHIAPALLRGIAVGDSVSFTAERSGGQYRIVGLEK